MIDLSLIDRLKARGLKDPAGAKRRMEEKARAAKDLEAGGTAGAGMKVGIKWAVSRDIALLILQVFPCDKVKSLKRCFKINFLVPSSPMNPCSH